MSEKIFDPELMGSIIEALRNVYDPEMPVNIYDLGLIYDISLEEGPKVTILMTLTNPNCPVADSLPRDVQKQILKVENVTNCEVKLTFNPPWDPEKMSDEARLDLGMW